MDGDEARHRDGEVDALDQHCHKPLAFEAALEPPYAEDDERPHDNHQQDGVQLSHLHAGPVAGHALRGSVQHFVITKVIFLAKHAERAVGVGVAETVAVPFRCRRRASAGVVVFRTWIEERRVRTETKVALLDLERRHGRTVRRVARCTLQRIITHVLPALSTEPVHQDVAVPAAHGRAALGRKEIRRARLAGRVAGRALERPGGTGLAASRRFVEEAPRQARLKVRL